MWSNTCPTIPSWGFESTLCRWHCVTKWWKISSFNFRVPKVPSLCGTTLAPSSLGWGFESTFCYWHCGTKWWKSPASTSESPITWQNTCSNILRLRVQVESLPLWDKMVKNVWLSLRVPKVPRSCGQTLVASSQGRGVESNLSHWHCGIKRWSLDSTKESLRHPDYVVKLLPHHPMVVGSSHCHSGTKWWKMFGFN